MRSELRRAWFQLHWFVGISAGSVLFIIGLSGATLAFRDEILDALNPGARQMATQVQPPLDPAALLEVVHRAFPGREIGTLTLYQFPIAAARVVFTPRDGAPLGESRYVDPYTGALRPALRGGEFFDWTEGVHRWLLLPRPVGQAVTGALAVALLFLSVTGLYLRWPRRPLDWRAWLTLDGRLRGRSFLRALHSLLGTLVLLMYLMLSITGIYWGFDAVSEHVDAWLGVEHPKATKPVHQPALQGEELSLAPAWRQFEARAAGAWSEVILRPPTLKTSTVVLTWLDAVPAHDHARNRMNVHVPDGEVLLDDRYASGSAGSRFVTLVYPLHLGEYFGLPGRVAMFAGGLVLPAFAVTGWLMYFKRRRSSVRGAQSRRGALTPRRSRIDASTRRSINP